MTLNISAGPSAILVPNVAGMDDVDAAVAITNARLVVVRQDEPSETVAEGTVIRTEPAAGSQLAEGSEVLVFVSSGPEIVQMPDLTGLNPTTALIQLDTLGMTADVVDVAALPGETPGLIVSQDPAAGTTITPGSILTLYVTGERDAGEPEAPTGDELTPLEGEAPPTEGGIDPSGLPERPAPTEG